VPAAIGNALYSLGLHLTDLPMSAERVLAAVDAREREAVPQAEAAS
jgi:CO/xanthine dehydrogenase Mo-binding subunit